MLKKDSTIEEDTYLLNYLNNMHQSSNGTKREKNEVEFDIEYDSNSYWKTINSLKYRLTRKNIVQCCIKMAEKLLFLFQSDSTDMNDSDESLLEITTKTTKRSLIFRVELFEYISDVNSPEKWPLTLEK
jgi:hypothetical protein